SGGSCARRALSSSLLEELSQHGFDLGVVEAPQRARALDGVEHALELVENDDVLDVDETPDQLGLLPFDLRPYGHRYRTSRAETTAALPRVAVRRAPCGRGRPGPGARRAWRDPSREPGERGPARLVSPASEGVPASGADRARGAPPPWRGAIQPACSRPAHSTVTLLARLRGWSTSRPRRCATS